MVSGSRSSWVPGRRERYSALYLEGRRIEREAFRRSDRPTHTVAREGIWPYEQLARSLAATPPPVSPAALEAVSKSMPRDVLDSRGIGQDSSWPGSLRRLRSSSSAGGEQKACHCAVSGGETIRPCRERPVVQRCGGHDFRTRSGRCSCRRGSDREPQKRVRGRTPWRPCKTITRGSGPHLQRPLSFLRRWPLPAIPGFRRGADARRRRSSRAPAKNRTISTMKPIRPRRGRRLAD